MTTKKHTNFIIQVIKSILKVFFFLQKNKFLKQFLNKKHKYNNLSLYLAIHEKKNNKREMSCTK